MDLGCYCAGSSGAKESIDEVLTIEWKSILPVCQQCCANGALPPARTKRRNGASNGRRASRARLTTQVHVAYVAIAFAVQANVPQAPEPSIAPRPSKRRRQNGAA